MSVRRFDAVRLDKGTRTDEGFLVADAFLTKTGVFEYRREDGSIQRELRLAEEVFHPDSLASFDLKPLTYRHPKGGLVTPDNVQALKVGVLSSPRKADDGIHMVAKVSVQERKAIEAVERGERQLSNGYRCDLEPVPSGVFKMADGTEINCDCVQRKIRGNHSAIVPAGRAGASASFRLDSAGDEVTTDFEETPMPDKQDAEKLDKLQAENDTLRARLDVIEKAQTERTKTDAAEVEKVRGENAVLKTRLDAFEAAQAQAAHRELCARVAPVVGLKLDELAKKTTAEVRRAALEKLTPDLPLEGRSDAYLEAAFDAAIRSVKLDASQAMAGVAFIAGESHSDADGDTAITNARTEMLKRAGEASRKTAS